MLAPRYQEIEPQQIPVENSPGLSVRVIAGETANGIIGPVRDIAAQPIYFDVTIQANTVFEQSLPAAHTAFIFVIDGELEVLSETANSSITRNQLAVLSSGNRLHVKAKTDSRFLLIAGAPFNEPVARHGPFVMNTREQIEQAFRDYRDGQFGTIGH